MLPALQRVLTGLAVVCAAAGGAGAGGPESLPDGDAIVVTGIYEAGTPCSRVIRDDGSFVLVPTRLHGLEPGTRVTVRGERMSDRLGCEGPALVIRGWQAASE